MIYAAFAIMGGVVALFTMALLTVSSNADEIADLMYRLERDEDLQLAYWTYIANEGVAPTARQLWEYSPPTFRDER